jgi:hypothetical protein
VGDEEEVPQVKIWLTYKASFSCQPDRQAPAQAAIESSLIPKPSTWVQRPGFTTDLVCH